VNLTLPKTAAECRIDIVEMLSKAGSGHPGGSLSVIDILVALFFHEMRLDPANPTWEDRDRVVLSKGHAVPALYAVLAKKEALAREELTTLRRLGSRLQGHPDRVRLPAVEASTGSLGQGLSVAQGIALGLKLEKRTARVFCILGDGECQEGQVWEAAMSAPKFKLGNLIAILDHNKGQIDGPVEKVMEVNPLADKWRAFRWAVQEINGHDFPSILTALEKARTENERPSLIIAHTIKGKGVSFMENDSGWHGQAPTPQQAETAIRELRGLNP
jgi:transketolase